MARTERRVLQFKSNARFKHRDEDEEVFDRLCWCGRWRSEHQWSHVNGDLTVTFTLNH